MNKYPRRIKLINWSSISVDRNESHINVDKYPRNISVDRNERHINMNKLSKTYQC